MRHSEPKVPCVGFADVGGLLASFPLCPTSPLPSGAVLDFPTKHPDTSPVPVRASEEAALRGWPGLHGLCVSAPPLPGLVMLLEELQNHLLSEGHVPALKALRSDP